ncbi:MAG: class I SAM-dependent methyltransferase [Candidatus Limnocylindrales bacterium]
MRSLVGAPVDHDAEMRAYYAARAPEYDDWYLRRGRYSHGVIADAAWNADLDAATQWLDALPIMGEIVELAAGTGWWSPLLASKGQLWLYDALEEPLDKARDRLLAHGLAAHIHVRDAWAEPERQVDVLFCGFWLSHVPRARLPEFLTLCRRWLRPGGLFAFIDSRLDPSSSATDHPTPTDDLSTRRLADGREFTIPKIYYSPADLEATLPTAGFDNIEVSVTSRFFLLGRAKAAT